MRPQNTNERGITITELMIVVVTIGIMAAMAVPRFMDYIPNLKSKAAVREVVSALRSARSAAIAEKKPHGVYFDYDDGLYHTFIDTLNVADQVWEQEDEQLLTKEIPAGVEMGYTTFNNNVVIFSSDGSASSTGEAAFSVPETGRMFRVTVLAGTGKIKMEEIHEG